MNIILQQLNKQLTNKNSVDKSQWQFIESLLKKEKECSKTEKK